MSPNRWGFHIYWSGIFKVGEHKHLYISRSLSLWTVLENLRYNNYYSNPNKFLRFCADVELVCEDKDKSDER